jgi:hypothetical protein
MSGNASRAIESFSQLLRISPVDPLRAGACNGLAWGYLFLERYDDSYEWATKGLAALGSPSAMNLGAMIASAVSSGRLNEANEAATELKRIAPELRIANIHEVFHSRSPAFYERLRNAFRTVKIPE